MEIVDTIYLMAFLRPNDPLHDDAVKIVESVNSERRVSQASLVELDLLMKSRGFSWEERFKTWVLLEGLIASEYVEAIYPSDLALATFIEHKYGLDYFDAIVSAQCILRDARPLTTDREILYVVSRLPEIINEYRSYKSFM